MIYPTLRSVIEKRFAMDRNVTHAYVFFNDNNFKLIH